MNLNELNSIADSIVKTTEISNSKTYEDVALYCMKKHNEAVEILWNVKDFIESHVSVFINNRMTWTQRESRSGYGYSNHQNCVIRDKPLNTYSEWMYWVDNGICFMVNNDGIVTNIGYADGHPNQKNYRSDFVVFSWLFVHTESSLYGKIKTKEQSISKNPPRLFDEISAEKEKIRAENLFGQANKAVEALVSSLKKIQESVNSRLAKIDNMKDESAPSKTVKRFVVEFREEV